MVKHPSIQEILLGDEEVATTHEPERGCRIEVGHEAGNRVTATPPSPLVPPDRFSLAHLSSLGVEAAVSNRGDNVRRREGVEASATGPSPALSVRLSVAAHVMTNATSISLPRVLGATFGMRLGFFITSIPRLGLPL